MKKDKEPITDLDRDKLFRLRCRSKEGRQLSDEDRRFLLRCWEDHNATYSAMERETPFGRRLCR